MLLFSHIRCYASHGAYGTTTDPTASEIEAPAGSHASPHLEPHVPAIQRNKNFAARAAHARLMYLFVKTSDQVVDRVLLHHDMPSLVQTRGAAGQLAGRPAVPEAVRGDSAL